MQPKNLYKLLMNLTNGSLAPKYRESIYRHLLNAEHDNDDALKEVWDMPNIVSEEDTHKALHRFIAKRSEYQVGEPKRFSFSFLKIAATVMIIVVCSVMAWFYSEYNYSKTSKMLTCVVPDGTTKTLLLSDGSELVVSGGSTVTFPERFSKYNERNMFLSGKAHFAVAHNPQRPFIITAGNIIVKVVGTTFNLRAYPDEENITASLETGRIEMKEHGGQSVVLKPNEQAVYNKHSRQMYSTPFDASSYYGSAGSMDFSFEPLRYILGELRHRFGVEFEVDNGIDLDERYNMNFKADETLDTILSVLSRTSRDFTLNIEGNKVKLIKKRKEG